MNLLQIPIMDKHFVTPMSAEYRQRGTEYAEAKGLLSPTERRPRANSRHPAAAPDLANDASSPATLPALSVPPENAVGTVH
jgi:hypothetical protein